MTKSIVVALDHAKLGTLLDATVERGLPSEQRKNKLFAVLDAALATNDKILYVPGVENSELKNSIADEFFDDFQSWIKERTYQNRVLKAKSVKREKDRQKFDPDKKKNSDRGGKEQWDMDVRRFMWENRKHYDFVVISADKDFLKNTFNADTGLGRLQFERVSFKSLMISLLTHPEVDLTRKQHDHIVENASPNGGGFGQFSSLEKQQPDIPESYEAALKLKDEARQTNVLEDRKKRKSNRKRGGKGRRKLFDLGTPIIITGAAAYAMHELITREVKESGLSYQEAARELGIDFSKEKLKDLAAEAGIDLAITLTPIGPLKKAWDVLGNIDDIVSLMQLYGEAYPDNEVIQQMAALADDVAGSAALAAYVEGRDALTGAVGGAIDWVFGSTESQEEAAEAIGKVRSAIRNGGKELDEAIANGASKEELTDLLIRQAGRSAPVPLAAPDLRNPDLSPERALEDEAPLSNVDRFPGSDEILPPDLSPEPRAGAGQEVRAPVERAAEPGEDRFARKTSYDTYRKLGRTPEEQQEALEHYEDLRRESYIDTGNIHMAEVLAGELFKLRWDRSVFAIDDGTVMKYPVEKAYLDPEKDGHGYVRADVEALLASEGIRARKWYLEPNGKTERDLAWGSMDRDGYGPRMTLSYDDEAGKRHVLTEAFQAHVNGARQRQQAAREKADRELAKAYGLEWPDTSGLNPFEAARKQLMHAARLPKPDQMAGNRAEEQDHQPVPKPKPEPHRVLPTKPLPDVQPIPRQKPRLNPLHD